MRSETHEGKDEDGLFLERVLDSLYDFGSGAGKKHKNPKKNKRKRCEEQEEEKEDQTGKETCRGDEDSRDAEVLSGAEPQPNTELKGSSIPLKNKVEVVTFQDPRKKIKTKQTSASTKIPVKPAKDPQKAEQKQIIQQERLSLEKARLEVHRFGITGYKKEQQRIFEQDRAIMLGATPPKKEYINYRLLQERIKEKKQKEKEEPQPDKKKKKKSNQRDKKKQSASGPGPGSGSGVAPSGQVGRFKNGMLILSPKEIQKIKGKR